MTIAVTGANSSVGRALLAHVVEKGNVDVIAGVRSERAAASLPASALITPRIISYDVVELAEAMQGASCVVHLAGILIESKTSNYASAYVAVTAAVVEASRAAGVGHIVLISVLGANSTSANAFTTSLSAPPKSGSCTTSPTAFRRRRARFAIWLTAPDGSSVFFSRTSSTSHARSTTSRGTPASFAT